MHIQGFALVRAVLLFLFLTIDPDGLWLWLFFLPPLPTCWPHCPIVMKAYIQTNNAHSGLRPGTSSLVVFVSNNWPWWLMALALFPSPPPPPSPPVDHIVRLLWKLTYRLIMPRQIYLVFILNLVKPLVTLISWNWREVWGGGGREEKEPWLFLKAFLTPPTPTSYFHNNRTMWSTSLLVKICRYGERKKSLFPLQFSTPS